VNDLEEFVEIEVALGAASRRMKRILEKRARELYPNYDQLPSDDNEPGFEGGCITKEDCREEAGRSLKAGKTAEDWLAERKASRTVAQTFYLDHKTDEKVRVAAFQQGVSRNDTVVECIRAYLKAKQK